MFKTFWVAIAVLATSCGPIGTAVPSKSYPVESDWDLNGTAYATAQTAFTVASNCIEQFRPGTVRLIDGIRVIVVPGSQWRLGELTVKGVYVHFENLGIDVDGILTDVALESLAHELCHKIDRELGLPAAEPYKAETVENWNSRQSNKVTDCYRATMGGY